MEYKLLEAMDNIYGGHPALSIAIAMLVMAFKQQIVDFFRVGCLRILKAIQLSITYIITGKEDEATGRTAKCVESLERKLAEHITESKEELRTLTRWRRDMTDRQTTAKNEIMYCLQNLTRQMKKMNKMQEDMAKTQEDHALRIDKMENQDGK